MFGSTAFSTYGWFWLGLGGFVVLSEATKLGGTLKPDSAAGVVNGMSPAPVLPVGWPLWGGAPAASRPESPMPRRRAA